MKNKILFLAVFLLVNSFSFAQQTHPHKDSEHEKGNKSNEHMHQSSTEDLIEHFESPERDAYQHPEKVMEYLGQIKDKVIIDIGAGSGYFSVRLAKSEAKVIAADVNDDFLVALKKRKEKLKLDNIEVRKIPYDSPGLTANEVDMAFIVNTYHHIENRSDYFAKVKQGTKLNGELVIIDFFKTEIPVGPPVDHKISIDVVIAELKKAGYTQFNVNVELLPYQYVIKAK